MKFNKFTDGWFDAVVSWAQACPTSKQYLLEAASRRPTRINVLKFQQIVRNYWNTPKSPRWRGGLTLLDAHVVKVLNKEFRKEFRFAFGEITAAESFRTGYRKVSAASELFSMVRQALTY